MAIAAMLAGCGAASHTGADAMGDAPGPAFEIVDIVASGPTTAALTSDGRLALWGTVPGAGGPELPVRHGRSYSLRPFFVDLDEPVVRFVDDHVACHQTRSGAVSCPPWWSVEVRPWPRTEVRGELLSAVGGYLALSRVGGLYEAYGFTDGSTTSFELPATPLAIRGSGVQLIWTDGLGVWVSSWVDARRAYDSTRVLESTEVVGVGAGGELTVVLRDGGVLTVGEHGTERRLTLPVAPETFSTLTAGAWQSGGCAVLTDHSVWCWQYPGPVSRWRCETERAVDEVEVFQIAGLAARRVAVGQSHVCAIDLHGAVWCWGRNTSGQVGDGTETCRPTPVRVLGPP